MKTNNNLFIIYRSRENLEVTNYYVDVISEALHKAGYKTKTVDTITKSRKTASNKIVVIEFLSFFKAWVNGYRNIIFWVQGAVEYESLMRHKNKLRFFLISKLQKFAMKRAKLVLFCSNYMHDFYCHKKYFKGPNYYVMPCFNEDFDTGVNNFSNSAGSDCVSFVYIGSLAEWQCFNETADFYKKIENLIPNSIFKVYVRDTEKAISILKQKNIENYFVDFVNQVELSNVLKKCDFGFCLRKDNIVNNVATPTKLSNYVTNGVIPIYSRYLIDFHSRAFDSKYCVCAEDSDALTKILSLCTLGLDKKSVYQEFKKIFMNYYSKSFHSSNIGKMVCQLFNNLK